MGRLKSFDYRSPFFCMVTLKRLPGLAALSEIGPDGLVENEITRAFASVIRGFHLKWRSCEEISPFVVMPDHLHLLVKIRDIPERVALGRLVYPLEKACGNAICKAGGSLALLSPEGFGPRWHPTREKERLCAAGRMLFLSLYEATARQPTRKELYARCHEMVDLALAGLS